MVTMDLKNLVLMIPHAQRLGLRFVDTSDDELVVEMPYNPELEVLPGTGLIANGAITAFLDTALGAAASAQFNEIRRVATLDLRVDYFEKPAAYSDVRAKTRCLKVTDQLVFVQADAYVGAAEQPFAHAVAAFSHMAFTFSDGQSLNSKEDETVGQLS
ncbi:PaaI family thioesterase [Paremcibacter congregatus]|uniref:Thioesterase n=1 Tax=Paremcibacter congregatus TaxID=2043170 RepID=A0A2G4YTF9_9PROT|nr:PaaI family thioesterase [Paremcibacter congregatus]PHZ85530.1 thioesterase [Paremcibacter congregatus]QDE26488.1 PaaI family thioesterase [Paremcibacter congregatus]